MGFRTNPRAYAVTLSLLVVVVFSAARPGHAQAGEAPQLAPGNPEFARYLEQVSSGGVHTLGDAGYSLGAIPPPVDLPHVKSTIPTSGILSLPVTYDLRTTGKVTSVKNQTSCGSCWTFATFGSMESCLLPGETADYSENNLKNLSGFDIGCCDGGNHFMSTAYLSRWDGPVSETIDPYNPSSCVSSTGLTVQKHVQEVIFLPDRSSSTDNDAIKQAVMTYGAVYTTFYWNSGYYNSSTYSFYYNGSYTLNHAVCIVGWDDNYDKTKFLTQPPGNGAFIVKNSWGTGWGQSGYFYLSYYDTTVAHDNTVFNGNAAVTSYDHAYQYDPLGWTTSVGYGSTAAWGANVFTSAHNGLVSAASLYAASPGTAYDARIYLSPNSGPINTSGWAARKTGTLADAGYHTIVFDAPVTVTTGQRFSVVIKFTTPGYNWPVAMESQQSGYSSAATAHPGESYISSNGTSWSDLTTFFANTNTCIKAFGVDVIPVIPIADAKRLPNGAAVSLSGAVVTGVFSSQFYVEADDRSSGIAVNKTSHGMTVGMRADVEGALSTNASGEKYINATAVVQNGTGTIEPLVLTNRRIGGADWEYDSATGAGQKGIKDGVDLNNIGMLVCTSGKVTYVGLNYFYVDDGSGAKDTTAYKGVKVSAIGLTLPTLNKTVTVCGASSCSKSGSDLYRLLRATSITVANP